MIIRIMDKKKTIFLQKLGLRITEIREEKGITQTELSIRCDKDRQSINRLEKGNVNPSVYFLSQICDALGTELSDLFKFKKG